MARYIDADALIEALQNEYDKEGAKADDMAIKGVADASVKYSHGQFCYLNAMERAKDMPAADVVPKSEVDKLRAELSLVCVQYAGAEITKNKLRMELDVCTKFAQGIAKIIESEIFDEITDFILTCIENDEKVYDKGNDEYYDGRFAGFKIIEDHIAELKKKYAKGDPSPAPEEKYFSPQQVREMSPKEIHENYTAIRKSMDQWQI